MQIGESITPPVSQKHDSTCPICAGKKELKTLKYNTVIGSQKKEKVLDKNLKHKGKIEKDDRVGKVFPFDGGDQPHLGWEIESGVLLDTKEVDVICTPHHLLPGAVMSDSKLEKDGWTKEGDMIIEDIGYNIDSTNNGIWLPHLPAIHWTRTVEVAGKKVKFNSIYGVFSKLDNVQQLAIGHIIMGDTKLQMHYTGHGSTEENDDSYNNDANLRLNKLAELMATFWAPKCEEGKKDDKIFPPYGLVQRIDLQSLYLKLRITGDPRNWKSWVSPLAEDYTDALLDKKDIQAPRILSTKH